MARDTTRLSLWNNEAPIREIVFIFFQLTMTYDDIEGWSINANQSTFEQGITTR
jgi:hypothetical protein